jgi:hypothetical protein
VGHRDWVERVFVLARFFTLRRRVVLVGAFLARAIHTYVCIGEEESIACCKTEKTKTLNYETKISRHFLPKKRRKRAQKRKKKRKKRGKSQDIFLFFKGKQSPHKVLCQTRARFPRLDDFGARTHAQKLLLRTSNSFERKGTRRDRVFFSRAFWSHLSLSDQARTRRFLESAPSFLSLSRERKEARRTPKHNTVLAFPIRAKRQRKRTQRRETRRKPTHIAASFARDERNVARFSSRRAFSLSPYRSRELERRVSSFRWALEGGRESESPLKKRRQKKEAKKSV